MRYAVFYPVNNNKGYDRHTFDNYTDDKIIAEMLREVDNLKVYNLDCTNRSKEVCLYDLVEDYNDEELDGGYWMIILNL
jgi:hypothetical protein